MTRLPRMLTLALPLLFVSLAGCQQSYLGTTNPQPIATSQYATIYDATIDILRDHGFAIDRKSYRFGVITTRPLMSPTLFEPWKGQNNSASLAIDSTVNELARKVTIKLLPDISPLATQPTAHPSSTSTQPTTQPGVRGYQLKVTVELRQREYPTRRLIGSSGSNVFNSLSDVPAEWAARGIPAAYWQPVGQDTRMEKQLLQQILAQAKQLKHSNH